VYSNNTTRVFAFVDGFDCGERIENQKSLVWWMFVGMLLRRAHESRQIRMTDYSLSSCEHDDLFVANNGSNEASLRH